MSELRFDEEAARRLLAVYLTPDVAEQRDEFLRALGARAGERVLDVGSGLGFLAAAIAEAVGPSGAVQGIDVSEPMLAMARSRCARQAWVEFRNADATQLPFPDQEFDAVISTQVLEYVLDVDASLAEMHRVLRPAGRVVLVDTDWDSIVWHSPSRGRMDRVLAAWEGHAVDPRLPRTLSNKLVGAGFRVESRKVLPLLNSSYDPNTYSNRMIDLIAPYVIGRDGITGADADAWARELRQSGERGEYFFSLNRYLFVARKP
jgi:ubiquinone/menaquinone biosynthesis C-methylase UbiE